MARRVTTAAAKGFNKVIVREDHDLRGRKRGDVADIVCRATREVSPAMECEVVLDEIEALRKAVSQMRKNEVIICFYEKLKSVQQALEELSAQPVVALPPMPRAQAPVRRTAIVRPRKRLAPAMPPA